jgi:hypothetical protein
LLGGSAADPAWVCGKPAAIEFTLSAAPRGLRLIFAIYDPSGALVADFDTAYTSPQDVLHPCTAEVYTARCDIEQVNLTPGRYRINVALLRVGEMLDHIEGAAMVDVLEGLLDERAVPANARGCCVIQHRWQLPQSIGLESPQRVASAPTAAR